MRYKFLFIHLFHLLISSCSWGQDRNMSPAVSGNCNNSTITYLGVEMKYPLTVLEAKQTYALKYTPSYRFSKTIPALPTLSEEVPSNF